MFMRILLAAASVLVLSAGTLSAQQEDDRADPGESTAVDVDRKNTPEPQLRQAPASNQFFALEVCNNTGRKVFVAVSSRDNPAAKDWYVAGWWGVDPGRCRPISRFPKSNIYLHAEDVRGGKWTGRDLIMCVEKQRFKRVSLPGYTCPKPQLRGFYKKTITTDRFVWRLT